MKRFLLAVVMSALLFSLTACGNKGAEEEAGISGQETEEARDISQETKAGTEVDTPEETNAGADPGQETEPGEAAGNTAQPEEGSKALVVYFSWSGNTEQVANAIARQTGADLFEIVPAEPYVDDYDALLDIATQEKQEGARPAIAESIENIDQYDVIYVGYPNWWSDMPMILYTFFDDYDLSGKTVAPFCTSGGSGFSDTLNSIRSLEPEAEVLEGLHIAGSSASDPEDAVKSWLEGLGN